MGIKSWIFGFKNIGVWKKLNEIIYYSLCKGWILQIRGTDFGLHSQCELYVLLKCLPVYHLSYLNEWVPSIRKFQCYSDFEDFWTSCRFGKR